MELQKWMLDKWNDEQISKQTGMKVFTIKRWRSDMEEMKIKLNGTEIKEKKYRNKRLDRSEKCKERHGERHFSNEEFLQKAFVKTLDCKYREYVRCPCGIVDVLTDGAIYELKDVLTRSRMQGAIGQLHLYGLSFPNRKKVIVCNTLKLSPDLEKSISDSGIEIIVF